MRDIKILKVAYLNGPNVWTYRPVLEAWVDIGELEEQPSHTIRGFADRLIAWLPSLIEHRCGVGERGGFVQRLREGTWPAHILEHVAIELQNLAGSQAGFGKARETGVRGVYKVAFRARNEQVGRAALAAARELVLAAMDDRPCDVAASVTGLRAMVDSLCLGPSTACIVDAAGERRIPAIRLTDGNLVQLGYGARQRRIWTAETDRTSAIAESVSGDKDLTKSLLASCGVPVPEGRIVESPADAWDAAEDIGLPVVVKPSDANHGRGVSIELSTREDVEVAFRLAEQEGSEVIVERFIPGNEHRLLVVGGKVVAAARGETAWVTGDGRSSVLALIDAQLNADPRRGESEDFPLNKILVSEDPAVALELARQGLQPDSVPAEGQRVLIQRNGNVAFDVTDQVHPEVAAAASLAARIVGLDIAGVDLVASDISRPLGAQQGAIVEVNAGPGLLMHLKPVDGAPRPVGRAIVEHLFPEGDDARIPVVGIAGASGSALIARLVAGLLQMGGQPVGLACGDGLYLDGRRVETQPSATWAAGQRVLMNRNIEAAVIENGAEQILAQGLAYDRCLVGVVTDVSGADALKTYHVHEPRQVFNVLRTQVDVVLPEGTAVLNADDPLVAEMAPLCDGEVLFYGLDPELPALAEHRAAGGRAVFLRQGQVVLARGDDEQSLGRLEAFPAARAAGSPVPAESLLAALGAAWALGLAPELIAAGARNFDPAPAASLDAASRGKQAQPR
ncbi:cyanophycin synthetase [Aquabacterium sp. A7-Y]|uniref:cyanophycin synthetase n=1 Tax=Aquabacterium sp. A7-Y TaxID=1349605 RepID=UPI00223E2917|nr:cyanophycin synthetase [Aquabacterium sp. A7-Y]MCW7536571.1 cyanophycin synthetase [Aquabacterium sp. A7-Y]